MSQARALTWLYSPDNKSGSPVSRGATYRQSQFSIHWKKVNNLCRIHIHLFNTGEKSNVPLLVHATVSKSAMASLRGKVRARLALYTAMLPSRNRIARIILDYNRQGGVSSQPSNFPKTSFNAPMLQNSSLDRPSVSIHQWNEGMLGTR
jgi:hypothetical protein